MYLKMLPAICQPLCSILNVLTFCCFYLLFQCFFLNTKGGFCNTKGGFCVLIAENMLELQVDWRSILCIYICIKSCIFSSTLKCAFLGVACSFIENIAV